MLGSFEWIFSLVEEERISPSEYYAMQQAANNHTRKRAAGQLKQIEKEDPEW